MENESKKIKYPYIPQDAIVTVEFSGFFINRTQALLLSLSNRFSKEELLRIFQDIRDDKLPQSPEEEMLGILAALVEAMESAAKEQKKIVIVDTTEKELEKYFTQQGII